MGRFCSVPLTQQKAALAQSQYHNYPRLSPQSPSLFYRRINNPEIGGIASPSSTEVIGQFRIREAVNWIPAKWADLSPDSQANMGCG